MIKRFVHSASSLVASIILAVALLASCANLVTVPSSSYAKELVCESNSTTEEAHAKIYNDAPGGTEQWRPVQDQAGMDRLKDAFNAVPPQTFHIDEVDELDLFSFPNNQVILYVLSLKGCAVGIGIIDPVSLVNLLHVQGTAL